MKRIVLLLFALPGLFALGLRAQDAASWKQLKKELTFIQCNDNGRNGRYEQKPVAEIMGQVADAVGAEAVLAPGDIHHYMGVQSTSDPLWMTNYELIYTHPELQIPWYPLLGNHEYRGNTQAVIDYSQVSRRWEMPDRYYTVCMESDGVSVRFVMIDSTPLIDKYRTDDSETPDARAQDMERQLAWIDSTLTVAAEDWVVVVGHHPVYAQTSKEEEERGNMQERVGALLEKHHVDVYSCGHIHNFQHIRPEGSSIDYVVNSSASLARKVEPTEGTQFCLGEEGFSVIGFDEKEMTWSFIGKDGRVVYSFTRTK